MCIGGFRWRATGLAWRGGCLCGGDRQLSLRVCTMGIVVLRVFAYLAIRNPRRAGETNMIVQTSCPISNVDSFNSQLPARSARSVQAVVVVFDRRRHAGSGSETGICLATVQRLLSSVCAGQSSPTASPIALAGSCMGSKSDEPASRRAKDVMS